jgi:hypothetical protein
MQVYAVTTDPEGHYAFDNIQPGFYTLAAVGLGGAGAAMRATSTISFDGSDVAKDLVLASGVAVELYATASKVPRTITLTGNATYTARVGAEPVMLRDVEPGNYQLCAHSGETEVVCIAVTIDASARGQRIAVPSV